MYRLVSGVLAIFVAALVASAQQPAFPQIDPSQARPDGAIAGLDGPGFALAYSEASGILAAACESGIIRYWSKGVTAGIRLGSVTPDLLQGHQGPVTALAWSSGPILASAGADQRLILWTMPEGKAEHTLSAGSVLRALAMSPDGKLLAGAGDGPAIQLWDVANGKPGIKLEGHTDWVLSVAFSPDGKQLAAGGYDGMVHLWDLPAGSRRVELPAKPPPAANTPAGQPNAVQALAFSPDGKLLAVGGSDTPIHLVNLAEGKIVRSLTGHGSSVTALAFHPSGTLLVSVSKDRTIRLWNPSDGQPVKTLDGHTAWVQDVEFMASGTRLASLGADQTVRFWDLTTVKK